ncbi:hypothetical protein MKW98_026170 [Papaver atlanticum]|uniref:Uncharacterized protein n=1 Tax=Papaver atlanticum TaxID=357466 RepID=A0AAD4TKY7_9MAGN|nr:hypothetical protein MKW98_026170 [Papaver atlanticum]
MDEQRSKVVTETFVRLYKYRHLYRHHPNSRALDVYGEAEELLEEEPHVEFNSKEGHGRYFSDYSPTTFYRSRLSCNYVNFLMVETEFEDLSEDGKIQGWESKGRNILSQDSIIDLDYYITVYELMHVDKDILKVGAREIGAPKEI